MQSKRTLTWLAVSVLALLSALPAADPAAAQNRPGSSQGKPEFVADELLVAFKQGTPADRRAAAHSQAGGRVVRQIRSLGVDVVKVQGPAEHRLQAYQNHPLVDVAELNGIAYVDALPAGYPNDDQFGRQWALSNTGQNGGKIDADIDAPEAWQKSTGASITVAIIDTGVSNSHADLSGQLVLAEMTDWAVDGSPDRVDPNDVHGHGTHVAGTVAALTNNDRGTDHESGIAGVCLTAKFSARGVRVGWLVHYHWIGAAPLAADGKRTVRENSPFGTCREPSASVN